MSDLTICERNTLAHLLAQEAFHNAVNCDEPFDMRFQGEEGVCVPLAAKLGILAELERELDAVFIRNLYELRKPRLTVTDACAWRGWMQASLHRARKSTECEQVAA